METLTLKRIKEFELFSTRHENMYTKYKNNVIFKNQYFQEHLVGSVEPATLNLGVMSWA